MSFPKPGARFMRRLLTGHATKFSLRHRRSGHLFQNRYKSIVCEDEPYLLELVRYIHLNPLRAGVVHHMDALEALAAGKPTLRESIAASDSPAR